MNVLIDIDQDHVIIEHHGERIVKWESSETEYNHSIVPVIANAVHLAHTNIMALRKNLNKPLIVGKTDIANIENGQINYYIKFATTPEKYRIISWSEDHEEAYNKWENLKKEYSDKEMWLLKSIVVEKEMDFSLIDSEVLDTYIPLK